MRISSSKILAEDVLKTWAPFRDAVGVTSVHTKAQYERASSLVAQLLDEVGDDEDHPLAEVLDYFANQIEAYEARHVALPEAEPREVLRFLMEQHGIDQTAFADDVPQSRISDILSGKREISKSQAKVFAKRFQVNASVFL
jgi:HTH-type transcriptional regulator / antitoxin HigA